ncbi:MAG: ATP-binding protein [Chromatiaceae bacterium]|nr:MAG: ATP-binding protein [Chromatiaceae bacterium]
MLERVGSEAAPRSPAATGVNMRAPFLSHRRIRMSMPPSPPPGPHCDLSRLAAAGPELIGRAAELARLDRCWPPDAARVRVVALVGPDGVGKTALLRAWLARRCTPAASGPRQFGWTFRIPVGERAGWTPEDDFLATALAWCGVAHDPALPPWEKGRLLATALATTPTLLLLDGLEALQYPAPDGMRDRVGKPAGETADGPVVGSQTDVGDTAMAPVPGQLHAPGVAALLAAWLAAPVSAGSAGLILLTTRLPVADLAPDPHGHERPDGLLWQLDLAGLDPADGADLLAHWQRARGADDAVATAPADSAIAQRRAISSALHGHALSLQLQAMLIHPPTAAAAGQVETQVERLLAAVCTDLPTRGASGAQALALLRLLALCEQPVPPATLAALLRAPPIPGLSEALFTSSKALFGVLTRHRPLPAPALAAALQQLHAASLVRPAMDQTAGQAAPTLDAPLELHPMVHAWCAADLRERAPAAWQAAHRRLYLHLRDSAAERPEQLTGLLPLYQALGHGGLAGLAQQACDEVYSNRILRGVGDDGLYPVRRLGALGTDLTALAAFFTYPWETPDPTLAELDQLWVLEQVIARLRALGRLAEALTPMATAGTLHAARDDWKNAAGSAGGRSDLLLILGHIPAAIAEGERCVELADRSANPFFRMVARTTLAAALHQQGEAAAARDLFSIAEAIQAEREPDYPLLYSLRGYQHRDLLLAAAEVAAWERLAGAGPPAAANDELVAACDEVSARASRTLGWISAQPWPLEIALDHLAQGRAALLRAVLTTAAPTLPLAAADADQAAALDQAATALEAAVSGLASVADQTRQPLGLLGRAWLRALRGEAAAAAADLDAAAAIAGRGAMRLSLIDIDLYRARLCGDRAALQRARTGIETCGYHRRRGELETAAAGLG